jgi:hypothetical protein
MESGLYFKKQKRTGNGLRAFMDDLFVGEDVKNGAFSGLQ